MVGQQMPFQFTVLSSSDPHTFKDGQIILHLINVAFSFAGGEMWRFHWKISFFR